MSFVPRFQRCIVALSCAPAVAPAIVGAAPGEFVEPEVEVLHAFTGNGSFGWAVSELGDVDGDGAMEAMAGAPFDTGAGSAHVFSGASGVPLFSWTGETGELLGYALADAGDVDGDAVPDIVVGAPGSDRAYVYSGADGEPIHVLEGNGGASFGSAVASAGDVDADGRADVLVGAETDATGAANGGRVVVFSGVDATPLWTRDGTAMNAFFGSGTAPLGDVDGDDAPDVIVGARGDGANGNGRVYVLSGTDGADIHEPHDADDTGVTLGQFFVGSVGDVDGDDVPDVYGGDYGDGENGPASGKAYVWSGATGALVHRFVGTNAGDGLGCGRGAGDADDDGVPDIATGSYGASPRGVVQAGVVTVWSGATGRPIRTITGTTPMEQIGFDVVTLGDVDGDGRDDLMVSGANGNAVYVVSGSLGGSSGTSGTSGPDTGADTSTTGGDATTSVDDAGTTTGSDPTASATSPGTATSVDETTLAETSSSSGAATDDGAGCGCRTATTDATGWLVALVLVVPGLGVTAARRRRA